MTRVKSTMQIGTSQLEDLESRPMMKSAEDGEYENTRDKDSRQVITLQKQIINDQDRQLEEIQGIVKSINYENQNFGNEVTL